MNIADFEAHGQPAEAQPMAGAGATEDYKLFCQIPDLQNGAADSFKFLHISAGIDEALKWPDNATLQALPALNQEDRVKAWALIVATVMRCSYVDPTMDEPTADRFCLLIAMARLALIRKWRIASADVEDSQKTAYALASLPVNMVHADTDFVGGIGTAATAADVNAIKDRMDVVWANWGQEVRANVYKLAISSVITCGVTLVFTQIHHFVDPHKQVARAVVGQVLGRDVKSLPGIAQEKFEDAIFHKAPHPIKAERSMGAARNSANKVKFAKMGLASAVVRVPAEFPPERAISAIKSAINQVAEVRGIYNIALDTTGLFAALDAAKPAVPIGPDTVVASQTAVEEVINAYGGSIAWCVGFLGAMARASTQARGSMSILKSKALDRIKSAKAHMAAEGEAHYEAAARWKRNKAGSGTLAGVGLFGASAPADMGAPAASP